MARALIVGCGCRGRQLAGELANRGHAVRGTTRDERGRAAIEAAGAEAVIADPVRLDTLTAQLEGVTVLCWLLASAHGGRDSLAAVHGARLEAIVEHIVDTPVRGVVYEVAGTVDRRFIERGIDILRRAGETYRMPVELLTRDPADPGLWLAAAVKAVERVLSA